MTKPPRFPRCPRCTCILPRSPCCWGMLASHSPLLHFCPQFISQFEEEIPILKAEVGRLKVQVQEPRETVFADVLLRRPKYVIFLAAAS